MITGNIKQIAAQGISEAFNKDLNPPQEFLKLFRIDCIGKYNLLKFLYKIKIIHQDDLEETLGGPNKHILQQRICKILKQFPFDYSLYDRQMDFMSLDIDIEKQIIFSEYGQEVFNQIQTGKFMLRKGQLKYIDNILEKEKVITINKAQQKKEKGNQYYKNKQYNQAINMYEEILKDINYIVADELQNNAYSNLTIALIKIENYNDAQKRVKEGIEIFPNNSKLYYRKGLIELALGNVLQAQSDFQKSLSLKPECEETKHHLEKIQQILEQQKLTN